MRYIPSKYAKYTYDDLVADVVKAGIGPKRAYMFLAGLGVKGELARWEDESGSYSPPEKAPVNAQGDTLLSNKALFRSVDLSILGVETE